MPVGDELRASLRALRLSTLLEELERIENDPGLRKQSFEEKLSHLVSHELATRRSRAIDRRTEDAGFPALYRLEDYDFKRMPSLDENFIRELHRGRWILEGDNLVLSGGHGLGKTHLAVSLGIEACEQGQRVLFRKAEQLVLELLEARDESRVLALRRRLQRFGLVVIDELGYTLFDRRGGELLHGIICDRYDHRRSTIVTTNLEFGRWVEVFQSKEMTVALLDRLTHRCDVIVLSGTSKRYEESLERQQRRQKRAAKRPKAPGSKKGSK